MIRRPAIGPAVLPVLALVGALTVAGCSSSKPAGGGKTSGGASAITATITVLAASSLTGTFTDLAQKFQTAHPGTKVTLSFGSSAALATQITGGSPADVFASASTKTMDTVVKAGDAAAPTVIAKNRMEIATAKGNPKKITGLADLAQPGVTVALCQAAVPCGVAAIAVLANAGLKVTPVTFEADVKSTLAKVEADAVDAGIVYVSDVKSAGSQVVGVEIPDASNVTTQYPVALLSASKNKATAQAFVDYLTTPAAAAVLQAAGFLSP